MSGTDSFLDTNILLYLLSSDPVKADQAEQLVRQGGMISVQVLNEITHVVYRKLTMTWQEIHEWIVMIRALCTVEPLTIDIHDAGRRIAERYRLSVYDAMIVASALTGGCRILYSEDMQHGMMIGDRLRICNPFIS